MSRAGGGAVLQPERLAINWKYDHSLSRSSKSCCLTFPTWLTGVYRRNDCSHLSATATTGAIWQAYAFQFRERLDLLLTFPTTDQWPRSSIPDDSCPSTHSNEDLSITQAPKMASDASEISDLHRFKTCVLLGFPLPEYPPRSLFAQVYSQIKIVLNIDKSNGVTSGSRFCQGCNYFF